MILKTFSRTKPSSYGGLLRYITKEGKGPDGQRPRLILHNLLPGTDEQILRQFKVNESFRIHVRKDSVLLNHIILSFSKDDTVDEQILEDIARKYFELRGHDGMYAAALHMDKEHQHIHVMESGLKLFTGKSARISKNELQQLKIDLQEYHMEKYKEEIQHSYVAHGSGKDYVRDPEYFLKKRQAERQFKKDEIHEKVQALYAQATSQKEFLELLQSENLHYYERNGVPTGIEDIETGLKFRFSRLETPLADLPIECSEEDRILAEIQELRNSRHELERDDMNPDRFIHLNPGSLFE